MPQKNASVWPEPRFALRRRQQQKQTDNQQGNSDTDERRGTAITQLTKHKAADDPGAAEDQYQDLAAKFADRARRHSERTVQYSYKL